MINVSFDTLQYIFRGTGITSESQLPYKIAPELLLPNAEEAGYRGAPLTKTDICYLAEIASRIKCQYAYSRYPPIDCDIHVQIPYSFVVKDIASIAQTAMTKLPMVAIPADADFWGKELILRDSGMTGGMGVTGALHRTLCQENPLHRRTDAKKISKVFNGEDIRNLYRDFADMRRFIIDLDAVGRSDYGDYFQNREVYPDKIMIGPWAYQGEKFVTHQISSSGHTTLEHERPGYWGGYEVNWNGGTQTYRQYEVAPSRVFITVNSTSGSTSPAYDYGILGGGAMWPNGTPILGCSFSCWGTGVRSGKGYRTNAWQGVYGWTTSAYGGLNNFQMNNFNLENFGSIVLRAFEKKNPEWVGDRTTFHLSYGSWFVDTGVIRPQTEIPNCW